MPELSRIKALGLECYPKPKTMNKWLLPVVFASPANKAKLAQLNPSHPGNWEEADIDGVPTMCYCFTGKQIKVWRPLPFKSVWPQFCDRLGPAVCKAYWPQLWIRANNGAAQARNTWERHHGGYRCDSFNRGMSVRAAASLSIY